jgi:hypothetical protein
MPPRFSVLTAVCDPPIDVLNRCLASVREQDTSDWEHVIVDDASTDPEVRTMLQRAATDEHVRLVLRRSRGGIVAASSDALAAASGDIVALLDHDDELAPHALSSMAAAFEDEQCDVAYSDHDLIRPDGRRADPFFKPDFSPERLRHQNYITHFLAARRSVVNSVGGFRSDFEGAQDHDLLLRMTEVARRVTHVPDVLYHWRQVAGSVALDPAAKQYAYDNGRRAVAEHCSRVGITARVKLGNHLGTFVVRRESSASVAVLVAAPMNTGFVWGRERHHLARLAASLSDFTQQIDNELVVAVQAGDAALAQRILDEAHCAGRVVEVADAGSYWSAALNAASSDVVVPVTERMMLDSGSNLRSLAAHLDADDVAMAGCLQLNSDRTVRHGGFVSDRLGTHPILAGWAASHPGPGHVMAVAREVGAVDVIGGALPVDAFREICQHSKGPDAASLTAAGVAFGIDRQARGNRVVWTPEAAWYRFELRQQRLDMTAKIDPYSNPNLEPGRGDWLEVAGQAGAAPSGIDASGRRIWS